MWRVDFFLRWSACEFEILGGGVNVYIYGAFGLGSGCGSGGVYSVGCRAGLCLLNGFENVFSSIHVFLYDNTDVCNSLFKLCT